MSPSGSQIPGLFPFYLSYRDGHRNHGTFQNNAQDSDTELRQTGLYLT